MQVPYNIHLKHYVLNYNKYFSVVFHVSKNILQQEHSNKYRVCREKMGYKARVSFLHKNRAS